MSLVSKYPLVRPSQVVNFGKKTLLNSAVSYSRGSSGTYVDSNGVIRSAVAGEPRYTHDPATGESLGLLLEEQRENFLTQSEHLDSGWLYQGGDGLAPTVTSVEAPDGGLDSRLYTLSSVRVRQDKTVPAAVYTLSVYYKPNATTILQIFLFNSAVQANVTFDTTDPNNPTVASGRGEIVNVGNGWYRASVTTLTATNGTVCETMIYPNGGYLWGAQLEAGSSPTSYIPTTSSAVTRAADHLSIPSSTARSGRIIFTPASSASAPVFALKSSDPSPTIPYEVDFSTFNSVPYGSVSYNSVRQGGVAPSSVPTSLPSVSALAFNFDKTTGALDLSTTATADEDSKVISLPAELSRPAPDGYELDVLEVNGGGGIALKEIYLWPEDLSVDKLASVSGELRSIGQAVEISTGFNTSSDYRDAGARPSLDLRFAERKDLFDSTTEQNLVDFSRESVGTYVDENGIIQTDKRINLLSYSEDFSNSSWVKPSLEPVQTDSILSPQGTQTADKIIWSNGATIGGYVSKSNTNRGTATNPIVIYTLTGAGTSQIITPLSPGSDHDIINVGNGWYRCWLYDSAADQTLSVYAKAGEFDQIQLQFYTSFRYIYVRDSVATQGDGTSGVYIWGAQLEEGNNLTEYIPTTNTTSGSPRFDHDPETGDSLGLLVEEARTNSQKYSNDFATNWTLNQNGTAYVIPNATVSPTGKLDASLLINATGAYIQGPEFIQFNNIGFGMGATYNLDTQTITTFGSVVSTSITNAGNGWYRCEFMPNTNIKYAQTIYAKAGNANTLTIEHNVGSIRLSAGGVGGVYIWGAQVEAGTFPTSYIPTPATFTSRASLATYYDANGVIQTAGPDVARDNAYFPDENGVMRPAGLLLEGSGTNLYKNSEAPVGGDMLRASATPNSTIAPNGANTGILVTPTGSFDHGWAPYFTSLSASTNYTLSVFVKPKELSRISLGTVGVTGIVFNASTGQILSGSGTVQKLTNGWYRVSCTIPSNASGIWDTRLLVGDNAGNFSYTANGTDSIYLWGFQFELGSYPTAYIPTSGSEGVRNVDNSTSIEVTRMADEASITGTNFSNWFNQTEGTFVTTAKSEGQLAVSSVSTGPLVYQDTTYSFYSNTENFGANFGIRTESQDLYLSYGFSGWANSKVMTNYAGAYSTTEGVSVYNGNSIPSQQRATITSPLQTDLTHMWIGRTHALRQSKSHIFRLTYWPARLSDTTLQALTDPATSTWDLIFNPSLSPDGVCAIVTLGTTTYEVDWGDGTPLQTINATGTYTATHRYVFPTKYTAKIDVVSGIFKPSYNNSTYADYLVEIKKTPDGWTNTSTSGFGTDLSSAWRGADNLTKIDREINTSSVTNFNNTWGLCSNLTTFPLIDTSSGTNFAYSWSGCGLTSFPLINTSNGTSFFATWDGCRSLANFPLINTSSVTDFSFAWRYCSSLTSFPLINTSAGKNFTYAWFGCSSLTSFPLINTAAGTDFSGAWQSCSGLTSFPLINTAAGEAFGAAWRGCSSLTRFPLINTAAGKNFVYTWLGCSSLTSFPELNFDSAVGLATAGASGFEATWRDCTQLANFPPNLFNNTIATRYSSAFSNCALTAQSIENILVSINTANTSDGILTLSGGTNASKATWTTSANTAYDALVARGWTIAFNA